MAVDPYIREARGTSSFGRRGTVVVPSNTVDLATVAKSVVLLTAGNVSIIPAEETVALAFVDLPAGYIIPYQVRRVTSTGTTATVATIEG